MMSKDSNLTASIMKAILEDCDAVDKTEQKRKAADKLYQELIAKLFNTLCNQETEKESVTPNEAHINEQKDQTAPYKVSKTFNGENHKEYDVTLATKLNSVDNPFWDIVDTKDVADRIATELDSNSPIFMEITDLSIDLHRYKTEYYKSDHIELAYGVNIKISVRVNDDRDEDEEND